MVAIRELTFFVRCHSILVSTLIRSPGLCKIAIDTEQWTEDNDHVGCQYLHARTN